MAQNQASRFWDNPYWAPVTEPLKNVAHITRLPINDFIEEVQDGWRNDYRHGGSKLGRMLGNLAESGHLGTAMMGIIGFIGAGLVGMAIGGVATHAAMAGAGAVAQWGATVVGGIAVAGVCAVAGPFVLAGVVASAAAIVGCTLGIVPGMVSGTVKAVKHHIQQKNAPQVAATTAAVAAALLHTTPAVNEKVSAIVNDFMTLPQQSRDALFTELERLSGDPARYPAEKMVAAIQKMPDAERVAVIEKLQERLSADFGTVAAKQVMEAQGDHMEVYKKPIRLKNKTPAATGST